MGGFKAFTGGVGVTSADVNDYLMKQVIMDFANVSARDAAITSPAQGMFAFTNDTNTLWLYDRAAWRVKLTRQNGVSTASDLVVQAPDAARTGTPPTVGTAGKPFAIQAGEAVVTCSAGAGAVTFPQAFPNGVLQVTWSSGSSACDAGWTSSVTTSGFNFFAKLNGSAVSTSVRIEYIAIGF